MGRYAEQLRAHYARNRSIELAAMTTPTDFFESLSEQIETEVDTLADQIAGPSTAGEGYMQRLGRLAEARTTAETEVLAAYLSPGLTHR